MLALRLNFDRHYLLKLLCLTAFYAFSSRTLLDFFAPDDSVSIFFIASGIGLATVLIGGNRYALSILLGSSLSNIFGGIPIATAIGMGIGSTLGAMLGARLLTHNRPFDSSLVSLSDWLRLVIFGGCLGCSVNAVFGSTALLLSGIIGIENYVSKMLHWWMGDMLGVIVVTPFILSSWQVRNVAIKPKQLSNALIIVGLSFLVGQVIFFDWFNGYFGKVANPYWTFLLVTWAAVALNTRWMTLVVLITAIQALHGVYFELGLFHSDSVEDKALNYWFYIIVLSVVGITLSTYIATHKRTEIKQQELLERLQKISSRLPGMVYQFRKNVDGSYCLPYSSLAIYDIFRVSPDEVQHSAAKIFAVLHPDDHNHILATIEESARHLTPWQHEFRTQFSDGSEYWLLGNALPQREKDGSTLWHGFVTDITERKFSEQQLQKSEERLQLVLEGSYLGFWDWNIVTGEVYRNAIWAEMLGYTYEEITQTTQQWTDFIYPDDRDKAWQSIHNALEGRSLYHELEYRMLHKNGSIKWILDHASIVQRDANGKPTRMSGTHTDITKSKCLEEQLRESENFFHSLAQINPVGIYRTDALGLCIYVNQRCCEITGMNSQQEAQGIGWRKAIMAEDRQKVINEWTAAVREQRPFALEYRFQHSNGNITWVYGLASATYDETGLVSGYIGTLTDISERKASEEYINRLAFYDPLTQLPNRRLLLERLKHGIEINHQTNYQMAVLMMDLDKFKSVNDNLGHTAGDELLQQVAECIKTHLREVDIVARWGGDEFVILMENIPDYQYVARVAEAIIEHLNQPFTLCQSHEIYIGVSIGIAIHPQHGDTVSALMDNADTALYHAKDQGRACFAYFSEELTQKARERIALESRLRRAIERQELGVFFQPQVDIKTGRLVGAEALVRWNDPINGRIMPNDFIALAEETGLIVGIGEWVMRETCRLGQQWLNDGLPAITLAVNVSPYQFRRSDIKHFVTEVLNDTGFPAQYLELEITESGLMDNQEHALLILNSLHEQGIHLAIDDFGTGYSSLAHLKYFPLDVLKIDKTFIDDIPLSQDDSVITSTIIAMAHHLGFKVLAEGVETLEQLAFLREQGCDRYQGYLYSQPLSATEFAKLLSLTKLLK